MSGLSIGEKRKILRREFREFNRENGFSFVRPNTLLRERGDILHYLQFKVKSLYMSCEIVSQPLYIPASGFSMSISTGIQFLGPRARTRWGAEDRTAEEFALDVQDMLRIISTGGLRWFEAMGQPENLIRNTLDGDFKLTQGYAPALKMTTVALTHLYLGHVTEGILYLEKLMAEYARYPDSEPCRLRIARCQKWIEEIQQHPETLPGTFAAIIAQNRENLHLKR